MAGKINSRSRYRNIFQIFENEGKLIFVTPRRPLLKKDFPDNITHQVRRTDTIDLISFIYYGTERFGWVIADFNNLLFPDADLLELETIILPSRETLQRQILPNLNF